MRWRLGAAGTLPRKFIGLVSIKDYPGQTMPGMFDELYRMPFEMQVSQSFAFVERGQALGRMNLALRRMRSAEDDALSLRQELVQAKDDVAAGRAAFGEHHTTIAVQSEDLQALNGQVAEVIALLGDLGINAVREDIALEPGVLGAVSGQLQICGARRVWSQRATLPALPASTIFRPDAPMAITGAMRSPSSRSTAAGPYFFNFHQHDLGNFTIIGPSGSGKTVVLNFLLAQARKLQPPDHLLRQGSRRRTLHPRDRRAI